ncbi:TadE family type IV pilus minor pilin [Bifidobacterium aquikefiricola]|uniref:Pilus assembly protein n=1 Tax=Bifidobacterium aquikefiricola TaxID=3059038 RepID=A0AB39U9S2_9BIFI
MWFSHQFKKLVRQSCALADSGTVTAEFAILLPVVMALAMLILGLTRTVIVGLNCQEAARVAAREIVVSENSARVSALVRSIAGSAATVSLSEHADSITVSTQCPVIADALGVLPMRMSGRAVAFHHES